ncbi:MAG: hypothetical protein WDM78_10235 [Puia sp.]
MNPVYTYTDTGTYTITLVATDSSTCNIVDSTSRDDSCFSKTGC